MLNVAEHGQTIEAYVANVFPMTSTEHVAACGLLTWLMVKV